MAAGQQPGHQHDVGDRYFAKLNDPQLTLVVSYNVYQRWTVVIVDRAAEGAVVDLHEENTLSQAQRYAEGYAQACFGTPPVDPHWIAQRP